MKSKLTNHVVLFFAAVTLGAFLVRLSFVLLVRPVPVSDFRWYFERGIEIANGLGYTVHGLPTAYWPPGWPYVLAAVVLVFGPSVLAAEIVQAALNAVTVGFVFLIGRTLFSSGCGVAAAFAYGLLPSAVEWSSALGSEPLYTLLWTAATYIWTRYAAARLAWFALSGVLLGAAALVRPSALLLWVVLFIYVATTKVEWQYWRTWLPAIGASAFCTFVVVAPWTVRNYIVFHTLVIVSNNGGVSLYQGNNAASGGGYTDLTDPRIAALIANPRTEVQGDRYASKLAMDYIASHPSREWMLTLRKIKSMYEGDSDVIRVTLRSRHFREAVSPPPDDRLGMAMLRINTLYYYVLMACALTGLVLCVYRGVGDAWNPRWRLSALMILYNTAIFAIVLGMDRYRYPAMPYFAVFAGYGFVSALGYYRNARERALTRGKLAGAQGVASMRH